MVKYSLKADMARDLTDTFLNEDEFAETRRVGNREMLSVLYETSESSAIDESGRTFKSYTLQVRAKDLPSVRTGDSLTIDSRAYHVTNVRKDYGMVVVELVYLS